MELSLRNIMEDFVIKRLDELLPAFNCCKCEHCRMDIISYSLNRLPSRYVVTNQGELLSKLDVTDSQFDTTITATITNAAVVVSKNPRH